MEDEKEKRLHRITKRIKMTDFANKYTNSPEFPTNYISDMMFLIDLIDELRNYEEMYNDALQSIEHIVDERETYKKWFDEKFVDITHDCIYGLRACSSDLNLIRNKDYHQLITLFKCAEESNERFINDVDNFDRLVTRLESNQYKIFKVVN